MIESTKLEFRYRRVAQIADITDLAETCFPGNRNLQHAAARILLKLKSGHGPVSDLCSLERDFDISRRTLQRARAKLARLGLIEHVTWMNSRYGGQTGWLLSGRMSKGLRRLADTIDDWRADRGSDRRRKEEVLVEALRPSRKHTAGHGVADRPSHEQHSTR